MLPPQSPDEIRAVLAELQQIDALIDIRWNAQAVITSTGSYSELGKLVPPTYDGRWQVIRYDSAEHGHVGFHPERGYIVIVDVTEYGEKDGLLYCVADGAYAPIDQRIVRLLRSADAWNVEQFRKIREKLWAQHDAREAADDQIDEGAAREALDHNHFQANYRGGVGNWQGARVDIKGMEARATKAAVARMLHTTNH